MFSTASTLMLTLALSAGPADSTAPATVAPTPLAEAVGAVALAHPSAQFPSASMPFGNALKTAPWMTGRARRPGALPALYATLGAMQVLDIYSTRRALNAGAIELNPLMRRPAGNTGAMMAVKALSTAGSIYFTERAWKKNRKGAVILMAVVNGVTAAVVANNLKNAR
ncbi:MAG: DUF5658 family protein [Vicinamibacterales bacterium]